MGLNLLDRIQAKIELFRLEQRYTRRRHRRSTFVSNAIYVDGEYIYQSPNTTGSSSSTSRSAASTVTTAAASAARHVVGAGESTSKQQKRLNRWSSMPGFGSSAKPEVMGAMPTVREQGEWRNRVSFHDERGY
ncbi:uncharacterized protein THITE_2170544 [Thermothielavioides terrestris NRRL 8126]|uniref:Uncharacterized protein n=1 Tax=Thermothielavioides terrestris (strain ATCC 38088 / NRRL 8126) TaxID=578455 RepID=G2R5I9_THETT|nr:uncharacterized protein THITE_2170544 [Thermothielavioides terrestris NRRL 8126]AEO67480.1 hypothetical protein THITE_2170544 [Thermothielavioides terrestris NRRL 8126]